MQSAATVTVGVFDQQPERGLIICCTSVQRPDVRNERAAGFKQLELVRNIHQNCSPHSVLCKKQIVGAARLYLDEEIVMRKLSVLCIYLTAGLTAVLTTGCVTTVAGITSYTGQSLTAAGTQVEYRFKHPGLTIVVQLEKQDNLIEPQTCG